MSFSFSGNLLSKSTYLPRFISLVPSKQQESQISSSDDQTKNKRGSNVKNGNMKNVNSIMNQKTQIKKGSDQKCQSNCQNHRIFNSVQKKPKFDDLLHHPSKDYRQKSAMFHQRRIEEQIRKNHQREMFYGRRKSQIVQISDVSSQSEPQEEKMKKNNKKRMLQHIDFQEDELLRKYGVEKQDRSKENKKDAKTIRKIYINSGNNKQNHQSQNEKHSEQKINNKYQQEEDIFQHLHPDYEQEKPPHFQHDESSEQLSEIDSDKSIIVIRRKKKHTHKRLKKMSFVTNKVKIQNKQNSGQTHQCPICLTDLNKKLQKKKGKLPCNHLFCLKCITEASKFSNRCPYCRASYNQIMSNGKRIEVEDTHYNEEYEDPNEEPCYICGRNDDFEHLLECEFCQYAYCHTYCDPRLNNREQPPEQAWHCASCEQLLRQRDQNGEFNEDEGLYQNQQ